MVLCIDIQNLCYRADVIYYVFVFIRQGPNLTRVSVVLGETTKELLIHILVSQSNSAILCMLLRVIPRTQKEEVQCSSFSCKHAYNSEGRYRKQRVWVSQFAPYLFLRLRTRQWTVYCSFQHPGQWCVHTLIPKALFYQI